MYERNIEAVVAPGDGTAIYSTGAALVAGSAVGLSLSLLDDTVSAGTITCNLRVAGSPVITAALNTTDNDFAQTKESADTNPVTVGDLVDVELVESSLSTTSGSPARIAIAIGLLSSEFVPAGGFSGDYIVGRLSADQTSSLLVGDHVQWDLFKTKGSSFSTSTGTGQQLGLITVQPGFYQVWTGIRMNVNEGWFGGRWHEHPSDAIINDISGRINPNIFASDNVATDNTEMGTHFWYFEPASAVTMKYRLNSRQNTTRYYSGSTHFIIQQIA